MKNLGLLIKSLSGMLFLLAVMGAALFLPGMNFGYPLAGLYLVAFFVPIFVITVYIFLYDKRLLQSRLAVGPVFEVRTNQKIIQSIAGLVFIGIYVLSAVDYHNGWSDVPLWLSYAADVMVLLSFVFLFFVFKQNTFLSATIKVQENQQVISSGLYGIVRHPMYSGASVLMIFTPIALGSYWGLILSMFLVGIIIFRAIDEEQELKTTLAGYEDYCRKVKYRIIPFIF